MALGLLAMNVVPALAATAIADVSQNYWAKKEIVQVVDDNISVYQAIVLIQKVT